jgi:hypothetical protein
MIKASEHPDATCTGCESDGAGDGTAICPIYMIHKECLCPCSICLVKMFICDGECEEWAAYDQLIYGPYKTGMLDTWKGARGETYDKRR